MWTLLGFFHRLTYATALSLSVFCLAVLPLGLNLRLWSPVLSLLNAPVGVVSLLVPCPMRGLDMPFNQCHHEGGQSPGEFFFSHLRTAIPTYVLLFYLPNLGRAVLGRWRRRRARSLPVAILAALLLFPSVGLHAARGPSTPEERAHARALVRSLEEDPLGKDARGARQWLLGWLAEVPDITVAACPALLGPRFESRKKYAGELMLQQAFSAAGFLLGHPDRSQDRLAVSVASVEGVLRAYEAIKAKKPKAELGSLDELLQLRDRSELEAQVSENLKSCQ